MSDYDDEPNVEEKEEKKEKKSHKKEGMDWRGNNRMMIIVVVVIVIIIIVGIAMWMCFSSKRKDGVVAPTGLTATTKNSTITLNWNAVPGASGYNVYISTASGVTQSNFGTKIKVNTNTASLNLSPATYFFAVSTLKMCGMTEKESGLSNEVSATTPMCPNTNLVPPSSLNIEDIGGGQIELEWPGVLEASAYNVYRAQGRPVSMSDFDQVFKSEATELLFTGLQSGSQQSFIVTTLDSCGKETGPSVMVTITVDCAGPAMPEITNSNAGANTITVSWGAVDGAAQYVAYVKKGSSVSKNSYDDRQVLTSALLSFTFTNLFPGTTYALGISASNACDESLPNILVTNTAPSSASTMKQPTLQQQQQQPTSGKVPHVHQPEIKPQVQKPKQPIGNIPQGLAARSGGNSGRAAGLATNRVLSSQMRA